MSAKVDRPDLEVVEPLNVAVTEPNVHRNGQRIGVVRSCRGGGPGDLHQFGKRTHVVPVLMRRGDPEQLGGFGCVRRGILQQLLDGG